MAEIDFDELDKAVNSIMSGSGIAKKDPDTTSASSDDDQDNEAQHDTLGVESHEDNDMNRDESTDMTVSDADANTDTDVADEAVSDDDDMPAEHSYDQAVDTTEPSDSVDETDKTDESSVETDAAQSTTPQTSTPLATKRRGQFMDMKHPSADMKTGSVASATPSRQGVTLAPLSQLAVTPSESTDSFEQASVSNEAVDVSHLDGVDTTMPESAPEQTEDDTNVLDDNESAPTSPFLPDAKVEKRPLGAPFGLEDTAEESEDVSASAPDTASDSTTSDASTNQAALPQELHPSVLEVEADTTADTQDQAASTPAATDTESTKAVEATPAVEDKTPVSSSAHTGPTSIPPQYTTKKQSDDSDDAPQTSLYDNAVEHPALSEHKKPSHWLVAIIVIIMLLLGAAGGAVLYLYQTGAL
ncbi:MAG TPA: hypothetical protein VL362_01505 [Patescibacteria group bacterium]|jgi:hypothetical protein|nr:hypothetical protein [Patescibacteria group bacterium]